MTVRNYSTTAINNKMKTNHQHAKDKDDDDDEQVTRIASKAEVGRAKLPLRPRRDQDAPGGC